MRRTRSRRRSAVGCGVHAGRHRRRGLRGAAVRTGLGKACGMNSPVSVATGVDWRSQSALDSPPSAKPELKGALVDADMARPMGDGHAQTVELQKLGAAHVAGLLRPRGPTDIARLVVAIDID